MIQTLLIVPTGAGVGLARTCLGLVRALDRRSVNVTFAKPVAQPRPDGGPDRSAALVAAIAPLCPPDPLSTAQLEQHLGESGLDAALEKIIAALRPVHDRSDVVVVGPLQYDAAAVASVGQAKRPGSPVVGRANVFIFPDLNTGNTTYKAVQRSAQVISVGPMLQGLAKPVNDLSRGALVDDIIYTLALTAIQSRVR